MAYQNWMLLSGEVQKQTWQLEITRAFVRESGKRKDLESQLNRVQQEAEKLRNEKGIFYDRTMCGSVHNDKKDFGERWFKTIAKWVGQGKIQPNKVFEST